MSPDLSYYEQNYPNYELQNPDRKMRFYQGLVERGLGGAGGNLLDLGCAFGRFLKFCSSGFEVYGQELNEAALEIAARQVPSGRFRASPLPTIAFDQVFRAVVAFDVLEHVEDIVATRRAVRRVLADDGCFVLVVPVYDGPTGPIIHFLDKDPTHVHKRSRWFWLDWLAPEFEVVQWWGIYRYLFGRYYLHLPTLWFRRFTPAIAVVARPRQPS